MHQATPHSKWLLFDAQNPIGRKSRGTRGHFTRRGFRIHKSADEGSIDVETLMADDAKPFSFRLITINGIVIDFQSPNSLEAMWILIKGDGYFQALMADNPVKRIPFHAIASLEYITPEATMIYTRPVSTARN